MALAISMVLLQDDAELSAADIQRDMAAHWPDLEAPTDSKQQEGIVSFEIGSSSIILGKMPAPFPWSDLEGPCATSLLWPKAAEELKSHQIHWIVTVSGELDELELSRLLTQATASLMATCPSALGVYWANATMIVPKQIFIEFAQRILPHIAPLDVWVDFRVGKDGPHTSAGFTSGMRALGHMEFEAQGSPEPPGELRERFLSLARYVVDNGPVINDGDTIGEDASERIRVVYSKSEFGHKEQVMRLEYEKASPQKPWWKLW